MTIVEIFYSLQGEGRYTGTPAVFIRFAGCNLKCWFCDTDFLHGDEMTEEQIITKVCSYPTPYVVITGGEPTLQLTPSLLDRLHQAGKYIMMETNGTHPLPPDCHIDWITCSPKAFIAPDGSWNIHPIRLQHIDELKVVYENNPLQDLSLYEQIPAQEYRLQPCDTLAPHRNTAILQSTIQYILTHPKWSLSLQTHKILNVK